MLGVVSQTDVTLTHLRSSVARSWARLLTVRSGAQFPCSWDALLDLPQGSRRLYVVARAVRGGEADSARGELGEPCQGGDPLRALPAASGRVPVYIEMLF